MYFEVATCFNTREQCSFSLQDPFGFCSTIKTLRGNKKGLLFFNCYLSKVINLLANPYFLIMCYSVSLKITEEDTLVFAMTKQKEGLETHVLW